MHKLNDIITVDRINVPWKVGHSVTWPIDDYFYGGIITEKTSDSFSFRVTRIEKNKFYVSKFVINDWTDKIGQKIPKKVTRKII
jgi:hypothetical protein